MPARVRVFAPASISNLGPGFDVIGLALQAPGDIVEAELSGRPGVEIAEVTGDGGVLSRDPRENVAGVAASAVLRRVAAGHEAASGQGEPDTSSPSRPDPGERARVKGSTGRVHPPDRTGVVLRVHKQMPLASGLGSSAASSVAGAVAVNELFGRPLSPLDVLAAALEGERVASGAAHADNAAPSLLGGCILIRSYDPIDLVPLPVPPGLVTVVVHPHCAVATAGARAILAGRRYSLPDAVSNAGNLAALVAALHRGDLDLLGRSIEDRLVEPLRAHLIPGFAPAKAAALAAGALGCSIAGAGPSLFAFARSEEDGRAIGAAIAQAFREAASLASDVFVGPVNPNGARRLDA
jgi:homoserine kinase